MQIVPGCVHYSKRFTTVKRCREIQHLPRFPRTKNPPQTLHAAFAWLRSADHTLLALLKHPKASSGKAVNQEISSRHARRAHTSYGAQSMSALSCLEKEM
jgi:hypothetical protein